MDKSRFFPIEPIDLALIILVLGVAGRILFFNSFVAHLPLLGDEAFYYPNSVSLHKLMVSIFQGTLSEQRWSRTISKLIGDGFFMPGISIILAPAHFIASTLAEVRFYIAIINTAVIFLIFHKMRQRFNGYFVLLFTFLLVTFPIFLTFNFTFWGESMAGLILVLVLLHLYDYQRPLPNSIPIAERSYRDQAFIWWTIKLALWLVVLIYLRQTFIIAPVFIAVYMAYIFFTQRFQKGIWKRCIIFYSLVSLILTAGIIPWSYAISKKFGSPFLLTTGLYVNATLKFGSIHVKASQIMDHHDQVAKQTGQPVGEILKQHTQKMLHDLTAEDYSRIAFKNLKRMFFSENEFLIRFKRFFKEAPSFFSMLTKYNSIIWCAMLFILVSSPVWLWKKFKALPKDTAFYLLLLSFYSCLFLQALISVSHGRYYIAFIPLTCFTVSYALTLVASKRCHCKEPTGTWGQLPAHKV